MFMVHKHTTLMNCLNNKLTMNVLIVSTCYAACILLLLFYPAPPKVFFLTGKIIIKT